MYVYVQQMKTNQYGKNSDQGIHLKKPTPSELLSAVDRAADQGFKTVYVYDSTKTIVETCDALCLESGWMIGWSSFCQTVDAIKIDFSFDDEVMTEDGEHRLDKTIS